MVQLSLTLQLFDKKATEALKAAEFKRKINAFIKSQGSRSFVAVYNLRYQLDIEESIKIVDKNGYDWLNAVLAATNGFNPNREITTYAASVEDWLYFKYLGAQAKVQDEEDRAAFRNANPFLPWPKKIRLDPRCKELAKELKSLKWDPKRKDFNDQ